MNSRTFPNKQYFTQLPVDKIINGTMAVLLSLTLLFAMTGTAQALQRGDSLPPELAAKLALDPEKITMVDFFASWCVSCRIELPEVDHLSKKLKGESVEFVGIQVDEDVEVGEKFLKEIALSFRVIDDQSQQVIGVFEPIGMPALYYIQHNKVLGIRFGAIPQIGEVIKQDLTQLGALK
ncbi:thioredoxin-like domain-containing protein [Colwellia sp.]|uniref:TlpA family protein disulfide reductase n=1 Tax=Colwellia sp. TaxID=56799 RepID=UPI0025B82090|nr:thioredoxin-like domain-containing protein [Colwellia sp.]